MHPVEGTSGYLRSGEGPSAWARVPWAAAGRGRSGLAGPRAPAPAAAPRRGGGGILLEGGQGETFGMGAAPRDAPPKPDPPPPRACQAAPSAARPGSSSPAPRPTAGSPLPPRPAAGGGGGGPRGTWLRVRAGRRPPPPVPQRRPVPAWPRPRGQREGGRGARAAAAGGAGEGVARGRAAGRAGVGGLPGGGGGGRGAMCERAARLCRAGAHRLLREPPPQGRALGGLLRWVGARMGEPRAPLAPDAPNTPVADPGPYPGPASPRGGTAVILDVSTRGPGPVLPTGRRGRRAPGTPLGPARPPSA